MGGSPMSRSMFLMARFDIVGLRIRRVKEPCERCAHGDQDTGVKPKPARVTINLCACGHGPNGQLGVDSLIAVGLLAAYGLIPIQSASSTPCSRGASLRGAGACGVPMTVGARSSCEIFVAPGNGRYCSSMVSARMRRKTCASCTIFLLQTELLLLEAMPAAS